MSDHDTIEKIVAEMRDRLRASGAFVNWTADCHAIEDWANRLDSLRQVPEGRAFQPGDRVEWEGMNGTWFPGKIVAVRDRVTTYDAKLDDGCDAEDFAAGRFRKIDPAPPTSGTRDRAWDFILGQLNLAYARGQAGEPAGSLEAADAIRSRLAEATPAQAGAEDGCEDEGCPHYGTNHGHSCGGCGESDPMKRCIGCQHQFRPQNDPVAWVRRHPDGALTNQFLGHAVIEPVRMNSGAWVPLYTAKISAQAGAELPELHPATRDLVGRFAAALAEKLAAAERKYGYSDGWRDPSWMDACRAQLVEHVAKGDPRDVAAYCAFLWHHGASTAPACTCPSGDGSLRWPCPSHPTIDANVSAVQVKLHERAAVGLKKYGVNTERSDLGPNEWLEHLQQELMDGDVYIQAIIGGKPK